MRWCRMGAWADVEDAVIGRFTHVVRSRRHWDIRRDCLPQRLLVAHLSARRGGGGSRERGPHRLKRTAVGADRPRKGGPGRRTDGRPRVEPG
ncbi:MAG: hypothetical protein QOF01_4271, partial [Thermomicrobiales bacterium]|nr:hypothetical protein [Thermomicrobiales bacterium]